jgi:hypothetical protein
MWMGGFVPIGYEASNRTLAIVEVEAETVRTIYRLYLERKTVDSVKEELDRLGLRTKVRPGRSPAMEGGLSFSRGHLYKILSNPIYAGRIHHKGETYEGRQPAIIDLAVWDQVQATLAANSHARLVKAYSKDPSLLAGLLFDAKGEKLAATHATRQGKRYRYYVSASALNRGRRGRPRSATIDPTESSSASASPVWRLPASEIEGAAIRILSGILADEHWVTEHVATDGAAIDRRKAIFARGREFASQLRGTDPTQKRGVLLALVERIVIDDGQMVIALRAKALAIHGERPNGADRNGDEEQSVTIGRTISIRRRGPETRLIIEGDTQPLPVPDRALIRALAQAHRWWQDLLKRRYATMRELAASYGTDERYVAWVIPLAFISPGLTHHILDGTQPPESTLHRFLKTRAL